MSCPECGGQKIWKAGFSFRVDGSRVRRFECARCGRRFTQETAQEGKVVCQGFKCSSSPEFELAEDDVLASRQFRSSKVEPQDLTLKVGKDVVSHGKHLRNVYIRRKHINTVVSISSKQAKDMETTQKLIQKPIPTETQTKLVDFSLHLHRNGKAEGTITEYVRTLKFMVKNGANLYNPISVKEFIANQKTWSQKTKAMAVDKYSKFTKFVGLQWEKPVYKYGKKEPYVPLEKDVDALIAHCGRKMSTLLQTLKETGARIGEALALKWKDVDFEQRKVYINDPEKKSDGRSIKVSQKLIGMLQTLPRTPNQERIFSVSDGSARSSFSKQRKRAAYKLQSPNLLKIHFHTLRHWKATDEYRKTRNILHVMRQLGHREIRNTLIYTHLVEDVEAEDFHFSTAKDGKEAQPLIEQGFEYVVTTPQDVMLFRKRK